MGIGREVADAYIDVHGDLSSFRRDLGDAEDDARAAAFDSASAFSDAWAEKIESDVHGKWASILNAMYSEKQVDWDRMFEEFNPHSLREARDEIKEFLNVMRQTEHFVKDSEGESIFAGMKLDIEEAAKMLSRMDEVIAGMNKRDAERETRQRTMIDLQQELTRMQDEHNRVLKVRNEAMEEANKEAARLARTFEGMFKDNAAAALTNDFKAMTKAMNDADWSKFAKGFDTLDDASRRLKEINALMHEQGRITDENAARMAASLDAYIQSERDKSKAMKDALDETNRLKKAQDAYNQSLSGMARNFHFADLEAQFKRLAIAMDSNDWSHFAKGSESAKEMQFRISQVAAEMHRLGRMTDQELRLVNLRAKEAAGNFRELSGEMDRVNKAMEKTSSSGGGGGKFRKLLGDLGDASRGLREHLGGFAGLNVFGDLIEKGLDFIHNLDRIAISAGKNTIALGSMAAVGVSALGGMVTLAADLGQVLGGLAVALPAFAVGAGIGIGVLIAAMKDMETVLADLKPAFAELQNQISSSFWTVAAKPIREMVATLMPILTPKLKGTAAALGGLVGKLATAFKDIPADALNEMFDRMNKSIDILGDAMGPLVRAFTILGQVGSKYFERFSTWMVKLSGQFEAFISNAAANGDLDRWINNMIEGFKDIGRAIDGAFGIFNALNTAAERAGFGGLKTFADALQRAAAIMQTPAFQTTLTTYFDGARDLAIKLGKAIIDLGPAFESFAPTANTALNNIGDAVQRLIGYIGDIFSNPKFQKGIDEFTGKLAVAVEKLNPAIKPFGDSLGQALSLLGQIAVSVAEVATAMVVNWSPVLDSMSAKLEKLIVPLKDAVIKAIEDLTPILEGIDKNIVQPLVDALTEPGGLIEVLTGPGGLTEKIGQVGKALTEDLGDVIKPLVGEGGVLPGLVKVAGELLGPLGNLFALFTPTLVSLLEKTGTALNALANDLKVIKGELPIEDLSFFKSKSEEEIRAELDEQLKPKTWGQIIAELLTGSIHVGIQQAASKVWTEGISPWLAGIWGNLVDSWNNAWSGNGLAGTEQGRKQGEDFVNGWNGMWNDFWNGGGPLQRLQQAFADWAKNADWGQIALDTLSGYVKAVTGIGPEQWKLIIDAFTTWVSTVDWGAVAKGLWDGFVQAVTGISPAQQKLIADAFTGWVADVLAFFGIHSPSTLMLGIAGDIVAGFLGGFGDFGTKVGEVWEGIKTTIGTKFEELKTGLALKWEAFKTGWGEFWGGLGTTLGEKWEGLKTTVSTKWDELRTGIGQKWEEFKTGWSTFWTDTGTNLSTAWEGFKTTVGTKAGEIKTGVDNWAGDVKKGWDGFWGGVGTTLSDKWGEFTKTTADKAGEIKTNVSNFGSDVSKNWSGFWGDVGGTLSDKWRQFTNTVSDKSGTMKGDVRNMGEDMKGQTGNAMQQMFSLLTSNFQSFVNIVMVRVGDIVSWVSSMPGRIIGAIGHLGSLLFNAGWNIMTGFLNGLISMWGRVQGFVGQIAGWIAANKGPIEYDRALLEPAGAAIMQGLENGLKSRMDPLLNTLQAITAAVTDTVTADLSKSVMYATGKDAAQGLADGLKANRTTVHTALGNLGAFSTPSSQITVGGSYAGLAVGRPTADAVPGRSVTIAEGAIKIETPTKSPELVAAKVIDSFVNYSTF